MEAAHCDYLYFHKAKGQENDMAASSVQWTVDHGENSARENILMSSLHWDLHFWGTACSTPVKRIEPWQDNIFRHINAPYYIRNKNNF